MRRCFVCLADTLAPTRRHIVYADGRQRVFPIVCASCGVVFEEEADHGTCRTHLVQALAGPTFNLAPEAPYGLDVYTLRTAATALGRGIRTLCEADRAALLRPHSERAGRGEVYDLASARPGKVSLGLLCRPGDLDAVLGGLAGHAAWTSDVAILVDAPGRPPAPASIAGFPAGAVRIAARPLGGDFAAQRNALQDLARSPWMLQLDADEDLPPTVADLLPALVDLAEDGEILSIGLPRHNRVDGVLSDVHPDVQYRLARAGLRYRGRVHERPDLGGDWRRSFIALHGAIEHRLSRAHVAARSRRYEAMDPGRGRPEEEEALLRPYRP
ncbi:hypothetical protein [Methylobacterium sp. Leaf466]|uniref:hypothetical protein n=1 Tax=Methylobacterium sp. Leaf466 TaxID=1736386 RepID=UPI0006FBA083|nr:hypothetical protein [Methylobacterium sp. Leaf466]KQT84264.1 hypothetical protein ASG59_02400 [Methylobacterium sp. Leaf466]